MGARRHIVGKRRRVLLAVGLLWLLTGIGSLVGPQPLAWQFVPLLRDSPLGAGWLLTGTLAVAVALRPRVLPHDGAGFAALYVMPAVYAAAYLIAWIDSLAPVGGPGYPRGWIAALSYVAICAVVMICSDWSDCPTDEEHS